MIQIPPMDSIETFEFLLREGYIDKINDISWFNIKKLEIGECRRPLDYLIIPECVEEIMVTSRCNQKIDKIHYPSKLKKLIIEKNYEYTFEEIVLPEETNLVLYTPSEFLLYNFPPKLKYLEIIDHIDRFSEINEFTIETCALKYLPYALKELKFSFENDSHIIYIEIAKKSIVPFGCKIYINDNEL